MFKKIKEIYEKNKNILNRISLCAASLSFYTIISISSLTILIGFIINIFNDSFKLTIIYDFVEILRITFDGLLNQSFQKIESINIILIFSVIFSASSIINNYNHYCDRLYRVKEIRRGYQSLISAIFMFLMLILLFLFLLTFLIYGSFFASLFENFIIGKLLQYICELFVFYCVIIIMFVYFPPIKMKFKDVAKESAMTTIIIYTIIRLFIIIFEFLYKKYKMIGLVFVFSAIGYLIYSIHFIICYVLYYIWKNEEYIKI